MRRLILHAGTHKTGTSTIQSTLHENRLSLAKAGVLYPSGHRRADGGLSRSHNWMAQGFAEQDGAFQNRVSKFLADAAKGSAPTDVFLLSAEDFSASCANHKLWSALGNSDFRSLQSTHLSNLAISLGDFHIEPVLVFRRVDEYAQSLYQTLVGSGRIRCRFEDFLSKAEPLFDYQGQISAFERVFGSVIVLPFDALKGDNLTGRFLASLGLPVTAPIATKRKNTSTDARITFWQASREVGNQLTQKQFGQSSAARSLFADFGKATFWTGSLNPRAFHDRYTSGFPDGFFSPAEQPSAPVHARLSGQELDRISAAYREWSERSGANPTSTTRGLRKKLFGW